MKYKKQLGLSNVVSTIMLVGVVVALVALLTFIFFNFQSGSQVENPDATIDLTETDTGLEVTVIRNNNVDNFVIRGPDGKDLGTVDDVGDSITVVGDDGRYSIIAVNDGDRQVIDYRDIETTVDNGVFVVEEDQTNETVEATLVEPYNTEDKHDIVLVDAEENEQTLNYNQNYSQRQLLSDTNSKLLNRGLLNRVNPSGLTNHIGLISVSKNPEKQGTPVGVGDTVQIHQMTNICPGDELYLTGEEGQKVLEGEELSVSINCDGLRRVAQYNGSNQIESVELINLWNQEVDYFVFEFDGRVPPPSEPVSIDTSNGIPVRVTVEDNSSNPIVGADVALGNLTGETDSNGVIEFSDVEEGISAPVTANANGYQGVSRNVDIISNTTTSITLSNHGKKEIEIELKESKGPQLTDSNTLSPNSSVSYEPSWTQGESGGSTSGSSGGGILISGGSGSGSYDGSGSSGGSVDSGSDFYSGGNIETTTTLSSTTPKQSEDVSDEDQETLVNIEQPSRNFNTVEINDAIIPTGKNGKFLVETVVSRGGSDAPLEDTVEVFAIQKNTTSSNEVKLGNDTIIFGDENQLTSTQELYFDNGTEPGKYQVFVTLESSDTIKPAGTLEVFDGDALQATPIGGNISPSSPNTGETFEIKVDSSDIQNFGDADEVTIDIFENGQRVKTEKLSDSGDSIVYQRTINEPQYVEYHVGVQESQEVALIDGLLVQNTVSEVDIQTDIQISNGDSVCNDITTYSQQFNCEVELLEQNGEFVSNSVSFSALGTSLSDPENNIDNSTIKYVWTLGSERQEQISVSDPLNPTNDELNITQEFTEDTVHYVELRVTAETTDGKTVGSASSVTINAVTDTNRTLVDITDQEVFANTVVLELTNNRDQLTETVYVEYTGNSNNTNETYSVEGGLTKRVFESLNASSFAGQSLTPEDTTPIQIDVYESSDKKNLISSYNDEISPAATAADIIPITSEESEYVGVVEAQNLNLASIDTLKDTWDGGIKGNITSTSPTNMTAYVGSNGKMYIYPSSGKMYDALGNWHSANSNTQDNIEKAAETIVSDSSSGSLNSITMKKVSNGERRSMIVLNEQTSYGYSTKYHSHNISDPSLVEKAYVAQSATMYNGAGCDNYGLKLYWGGINTVTAYPGASCGWEGDRDYDRGVREITSGVDQEKDLRGSTTDYFSGASASGNHNLLFISEPGNGINTHDFDKLYRLGDLDG
jgi:hypothetical protein